MFLIRQLRNRNGFRFVSRQWFLLRLKINSIYNGYVELFKFQSIFVHSVFCDRNLQNRRRRKSFNKHVIFLSQNLQTDWKKQNMNFWCEKKKKNVPSQFPHLAERSTTFAANYSIYKAQSPETFVILLNTYTNSFSNIALDHVRQLLQN